MSDDPGRSDASFPVDWQSKPLGELVDSSRPIVYGILMPGYGFPGGVPVVKVKDIRNGRIESSDLLLTSPELDNSYRRSRLRTGDLLFTIRGTVGRTAVVPTLLNGSNITQDTARIGITKGDTQFVRYCLETENVQRFVSVHTLGVAVQGINLGDVRRIPLTLPCLTEQRKIARILTTVDNLIEKTEALIAKYQAIKQGMMHDLFTRGVDEHGHLRPPYEEAPELYKQSELSWIPRGWEVRKLGEIAVVGGGVTLGRDLVGSQVVELPYLWVANVQDGYLDLSEIKTVSVLKSEVDRYRLEHGDMLMTEGGDFDKLGRGTVWRGQIAPCLHQNHIFRVRPLRNFILPDFLATVTASSYGKRYFLVSSKQTTNLATINSTQLKAFPVPLPTLDEQGRMVTAIASVERQIETEQSVSSQIKHLKTGLMQDLLTGRVRVKVDEAEEVAV